MVWEATPAIAISLGAMPHDAAFPESLCGTSLPLRVALTPTASRCPRSPVFQSGRIRIRICTVVLRRSAGNIGARRLLTSTRGLLTSTGTGSCTCFSWVAARTHMYYSSAARVAGPGDDSSRCLRVQAVHADLACRAAALGVEEVDRGLKCGL